MQSIGTFPNTSGVLNDGLLPNLMPNVMSDGLTSNNMMSDSMASQMVSGGGIPICFMDGKMAVPITPLNGLLPAPSIMEQMMMGSISVGDGTNLGENTGGLGSLVPSWNPIAQPINNPSLNMTKIVYQTYQTNNGLGTPTQPLYSTGIPLTPQTIPGTNFLPNPLSFPTGVFPRLHKPYKYLKAMKRKHDGNYGNANASAPPGLLQPLYCKVCCVNLNAPSQAKQHYEGKAHSKKLKQYLSKEATENSPSQSPNGGSTGSEPVSPNDKSTDSASVSPSKSTTDIKPDVYCKVCGVSFNSEKQSLQHYNGKSHVKRLRATHTATNPVTSESAVSTKQSSKFICFVCNIDLTSQGQLDNHLKGMKHLATMQKQERSQTTLKGRWGTNGSTPTAGAVASLPMGIRQATNGFSNFEPPPTKRPRYRDFSNYRTPSGNYYCSYCNVTMATEPQFGQHIESKKHKATYSQKKTLEQCESPVESVA